MKLISIIFCAAVAILTVISSCEKSDPEPTIKEINTAYLTEKSGGWNHESVNLPPNTATIEDEWISFEVIYSSTTMTTSGHAEGATAVWPSGGWTMNEEGTTITRAADNVVMEIVSISETRLIVRFTIPDDVHTDGRIATLGGEYTFTLN